MNNALDHPCVHPLQTPEHAHSHVLDEIDADVARWMMSSAASAGSADLGTAVMHTDAVVAPDVMMTKGSSK